MLTPASRGRPSVDSAQVHIGRSGCDTASPNGDAAQRPRCQQPRPAPQHAMPAPAEPQRDAGDSQAAPPVTRRRRPAGPAGGRAARAPTAASAEQHRQHRERARRPRHPSRRRGAGQPEAEHRSATRIAAMPATRRADRQPAGDRRTTRIWTRPNGGARDRLDRLGAGLHRPGGARRRPATAPACRPAGRRTWRLRQVPDATCTGSEHVRDVGPAQPDGAPASVGCSGRSPGRPASPASWSSRRSPRRTSAVSASTMPTQASRSPRRTHCRPPGQVALAGRVGLAAGPAGPAAAPSVAGNHPADERPGHAPPPAPSAKTAARLGRRATGSGSIGWRVGHGHLRHGRPSPRPSSGTRASGGRADRRRRALLLDVRLAAASGHSCLAERAQVEVVQRHRLPAGRPEAVVGLGVAGHRVDLAPSPPRWARPGCCGTC